MTEKKVGYSYDGGHWIVELKGFHKHPKLFFFMREEDAQGWVEVLNGRYNLKVKRNEKE